MAVILDCAAQPIPAQRPGNWRRDGPRYFGRPPSDGVSRPAVRAQIVNESGGYLLSLRRHVACSDNLWPADVVP